ncbi:hypothetical protein K2173_027410 [Erythroxylum novogranatense]|uniref:BHLH domain-containing protein n=1 Tax=Erythroxylum novogranatense TaxID=1862640 RepID=A0AAV8U2U7_9ROSI|nr:hypothetical protein K2173_027410 [Erythroxylum novogranatense]
MALEAVVYAQDAFGYVHKDSYGAGGGGGSWSSNCGFKQDGTSYLGVLDHNFSNIERLQGQHENWDSSSPSIMRHAKEWDPNSSPETCSLERSLPGKLLIPATMEQTPATDSGRPKRRRTKNTKNKEEIENQRMTHITVERNRRKQMNEYLAAIRSLMPPSYAQRGDQASIIGGAINFVKELEQLLRTMEADKRSKQQAEVNGYTTSPFVDFFSSPQYSTRAAQSPGSVDNQSTAAETHWAAADIEVTMVESHANLKILSKKRPRQLLKMVAGLQCLRLTILHLNITALDQVVLYSVSVKVEEGCHLTTVDEIAAAINQMLHRIEEEAVF